MIYFIKAVGADAVKIGWCSKQRNFQARLAALQCACPLPLSVMGTVAGVSEVRERALHNFLAPHRIRGEWFRLSAIRRHISSWLRGKDLPFSLPARPSREYLRHNYKMADKAMARAIVVEVLRITGDDMGRAAKILQQPILKLIRRMRRLEVPVPPPRPPTKKRRWSDTHPEEARLANRRHQATWAAKHPERVRENSAAAYARVVIRRHGGIVPKGVPHSVLLSLADKARRGLTPYVRSLR